MSDKIEEPTAEDAGTDESGGKAGYGGNGGVGVNCDTLASGSINPKGGSGCDINMGTSSSSAGHNDLMMSRNNADTYVLPCLFFPAPQRLASRFPTALRTKVASKILRLSGAPVYAHAGTCTYAMGRSTRRATT